MSRISAIILGIDGMDFEMAVKFSDSGLMPALSRIRQNGAFLKAKSPIPPITPTCWTTIATGTNPGTHGVFDFGTRLDNSYEIRLINSNDISAPRFWDYFPEGITAGILNLPLCWPPRPISGFMICGMDTPSIQKGVWPPELINEIPADYLIDTMVHWRNNISGFYDEVIRMMHIRHSFFMDLIRKKVPNIAMPIYVELDRLCHAFFGSDQDQLIQRAYIEIDSIIDDWANLAQAHGAFLMIISDHGFSKLEFDLFPNALFLQENLMAFSPEKVRSYIIPDQSFPDDLRHHWHDLLKQKLPFRPLPSKDVSIIKGEIDPRYKVFSNLDWSKTFAYSHGLSCGIYLNLQGRESEGIVNPGKDAEKISDQIINLFMKLKSPSGEPIINKVWRREELFIGKMAHRSPDLILEPAKWASTTRGATEFLSVDPIAPPAVNHTGHHNLSACFGMLGDPIRAGITGECNLVDFAPCLFALLDLPFPSQIEGRLLSDAFSTRYLSKHPIIDLRSIPSKTAQPIKQDDHDNEEIMKRLKGIGYFG